MRLNNEQEDQNCGIYRVFSLNRTIGIYKMMNVLRVFLFKDTIISNIS